jgi:hypothetical protein
MISELLKCYNSDGSLKDNYCENIILPYLEENELKDMIEITYSNYE